MPMKQFKDLKIGEQFEVYGDQFLNYDYPKICKCTKTGEDSAQEIDGMHYLVEKYDYVFVT